MSLPWLFLIRGLLDGLEAEWPVDDDSGVKDACVVCSDRPDTMCLMTGDGPVHVCHEAVDVLPYALDVDESTRTQSVRVAGWEVAQLRIHPSGMSVSVLGEGTLPATESTWIDVALTLWGFAPPIDYATKVEHVIAQIERRTA